MEPVEPTGETGIGSVRFKSRQAPIPSRTGREPELGGTGTGLEPEPAGTGTGLEPEPHGIYNAT